MRIDMAETTIIGGGIVGLCVAMGLLEAGRKVRVLDGVDSDQRASQGNFGLVWLQGKGASYAPYAKWTYSAVSAWANFAARIRSLSGIDLELDQSGGYEFITAPERLAGVTQDLAAQRAILGPAFDPEILTQNELRHRIDGIGKDVIGATFCPQDGHVNPLHLLHALRRAVKCLGGQIIPEAPVDKITVSSGGGFSLTARDGTAWGTERVILCAGLGSMTLGPQLGFDADIRPQRGELLITEKLGTRLPFISDTIRQVGEGGIQIGGTKAEAGLDDRDTVEMAAQLARHAVTVFPALADVRVLRSWAALRVMSPDGYPIYAKSPKHSGAFLVTCHSGVTLAPNHAADLVKWVEGTSGAPNLEAFDENRFALLPAA